MRVTVYLGSKIAEVHAHEGQEPVIRCPEPFDGNEFAALSCIAETVRAWAGGRNIDRYFNPTQKSKAEDLVLVLCMWERSGKLVVKDETPDRKYCHADTVEQAVASKRSFTCYRYLLPELPKRRDVDHGS